LKKFNKLDEAKAPDGTVLTLYEHDGEYAIRIGNVELMSTRRHQSEARLGEIVCEPLAAAAGVRVLIGGLGLGFTLVAALRVLGSDARVVVAEIVARVIDWNRNPAYSFASPAIDDPRVELRAVDVADVFRENEGAFDAIMLDVDNGAESLTTKGNAVLYHDEGIQLALAALRPGGALAYWSADGDPTFLRALRRANLRVEILDVPIYPGAKTHYTLFIARSNTRTKERAG
jgi:spermidine synthase